MATEAVIAGVVAPQLHRRVVATDAIDIDPRVVVVHHDRVTGSAAGNEVVIINIAAGMNGATAADVYPVIGIVVDDRQIRIFMLGYRHGDALITVQLEVRSTTQLIALTDVDVCRDVGVVTRRHTRQAGVGEPDQAATADGLAIHLVSPDGEGSSARDVDAVVRIARPVVEVDSCLDVRYVRVTQRDVMHNRHLAVTHSKLAMDVQAIGFMRGEHQMAMARAA